jgi:hypothetical protein
VTGNESASETYTSPGDRDFPGPTKTQTISGAIKELFGAAKAVLRRAAKEEDDEDEPQPRRRIGETDKAVGRVDVRAYRAAERGQPGGRYDGLKAKAGKQTSAAARSAEPKAAPEPLVAPADTYARACLSLADNLDWLNMWGANANNEQWHNDDFSAKQDQFFPQP